MCPFVLIGEKLLAVNCLICLRLAGLFFELDGACCSNNFPCRVLRTGIHNNSKRCPWRVYVVTRLHGGEVYLGANETFIYVTIAVAISVRFSLSAAVSCVRMRA